MPRFSQQVLNALSNPQAGMLTGQAIANVGGRLAQIPEEIRAEQQRKAQQAALQQGMLGYASQDPAALAEAAQAFARSGGDPRAALSLAGAASDANKAQQQAARTGALRQNVVSRASNLPGFEGMVEAAASASAEQLESMRVQLLQAETSKQQRTDEANRAANSATSVGVSEDLIDVFKDDPEGLMNLSRKVAEKRETSRLDAIEDNRQKAIQVARAKEAGLPPSIVKDIESGIYVGRNNDFADLVSGKAFSSQNYQIQEGSAVQGQPSGSLINLPTLGGKVVYNNKMYYPNELGLIEGPKVTAEGSVSKMTSETKMLPFAASAAGVIKGFINGLNDIEDLNTKIAFAAGESVIPFNTDTARSLRAFQSQVPEVLSRIASGAAIKDDELPRYEAMFSVKAADLTAPLSAAEKVIRTAALVSISSKIMSGEVSTEEGRRLIEEAGSIVLSEDDANKIRKGGKGSLKSVVKKYTDTFLKDSGQTSSSIDTVDSIRNKYNF